MYLWGNKGQHVHSTQLEKVTMAKCSLAGSTYNFKCLHCAARYVVAARPSKQRQLLAIEYLKFYYGYNKDDIVNKIQELKI